MRHIVYKVVIRIVIISLVLVFISAKASSYYGLNDAITPNNWYVDVSIGKSYEYGYSSSPTEMTDSSGHMLFQTNQAAAPPFFSSAIGHLWSLQTDYLPFISLGIQYHYTAPILMSGVIYDVDEDNVELEPSLYSRYQIKQHSCSALTKLDLYRWQNFMPYFSLGLGASWNQINNFNTLEFDPEHEDLDRLTLLAHGNTTTDFTYSLGAGLDYIVNQDLWLSIGYNYDNFGNNEIGPLLKYDRFDAPLTPLSAVAKNERLHAHSAMFTARYLFG